MKVIREKLFKLFKRINDFERTSLHKHCIIFYSNSYFFIYIPEISLSFKEKITEETRRIISLCDKISDDPRKLKRGDPKANVRSSTPVTRKFLKSLKTEIKKDGAFASCYWYIIQFNVFSITDCLYTENFMIDNETMSAFCDFLLEERFLALTSTTDFSNLTLPFKGRRLLSSFEFKTTFGDCQLPTLSSVIIDSSINIYDNEQNTDFSISEDHAHVDDEKDFLDENDLEL